MKSGIVCTMVLSFLLAAAAPLQVMAEEVPTVTQVTEQSELPLKKKEVMPDKSFFHHRRGREDIRRMSDCGAHLGTVCAILYGG